MHFVERKLLYFDKMSLKFIPIGPIDNKSALVQVGDYMKRPAVIQETTLTESYGVIWRHWVSMS